MKNKSYSQQAVAELFSTGNFQSTFPYLSEKIVWHVVGENTFTGKKNVIDHCEGIQNYFNSVQTDFKIDDLIVLENKVIVRGSGEFIKDGKRVSLVMACDAYKFDKKTN